MSADPPADAPLSVEQAWRAYHELLWEFDMADRRVSTDPPLPTDAEVSAAQARVEQAIAAAAVTEARAVLQDIVREWDAIPLRQNNPDLERAVETARALVQGAAGSGSTP